MDSVAIAVGLTEADGSPQSHKKTALAADTAATFDRENHQAFSFLSALFDPDDLVLFRPIETWTEGQRKKSRVLFKQTRYSRPTGTGLKQVLEHLGQVAIDDRANIFFGVCPRFGGDGKFDLAWQIRMVRTLWADVDQVSVEETLARVQQAGLPIPSVVVSSGNGAHLYWLLDRPFLIDDADEPPPVVTEWIENEPGKKKERRTFYYDRDGERVYPNRGRNPKLSAKAQQIQDIMQGIAASIGGDHTQDLSRLLRLPGTKNRKDERNGREPIECLLALCTPNCRYSISQFESFAEHSPDAKRREKIKYVPLPSPRKLTPAKKDKLAGLVAQCALAEKGHRSESDFRLCCAAIEMGQTQAEVWGRVSDVGKFAEGGERYFNATWQSAEERVRSKNYAELQASASKSESVRDRESRSSPEIQEAAADHSSSDFLQIDICASSDTVGEVLDQITGHLIDKKACYRRSKQVVVVKEADIKTILTPAEMTGMLNEHMEFFIIGEKTGEYKPLPTPYCNTLLNKSSTIARLPEIKLFSRNPIFTDEWRLVDSGYDAATGIYYAGPKIEPRDGTEHLDALLAEFCFRSTDDGLTASRTNYIGALLTTLLVYQFIGSKPAILFNGNQPGLGKSILAQILAILRDGEPVETATYNPNDEEFEKRLGALVRRGFTTLIIDNAKGKQGRNPRIESACLERSITDPVLSFRLLGVSGSIRAENSHLFCITANTPDVSRDLVSRSMLVDLYYEGDPTLRKFEMADPEGFALEYRTEILGELIGMVERWKEANMPEVDVDTRFNKKGWGRIIGGILESCGHQGFLANADAIADAMDYSRRDFNGLIEAMAADQRGTWTAGEMAQFALDRNMLKDELGDGSDRSKATKMGVLLTRFVGMPFEVLVDRTPNFAHLESDTGRNGKIYRVGLTDKPPF